MRLVSGLLGFLGFVLCTCAIASEVRHFEHPGVLHSQESLEDLRERVASEDPVALLGYEQLLESEYAKLNRPHSPYEIVAVAASAGTPEELAFRGDAQAAYAMALQWVITGDSVYRDKAIAILDDWAATYREMRVTNGYPPQKQLEAAWAAPIWVAAAEIIRYYGDGSSGWSGERVEAFDRFLDDLVETARPALDERDNNWATSATLALMAVAVYQDDAEAYDEALAYYRRHFAAISRPDGSLATDYLRDPGHPQYTVLTWIQSCEIAWVQGDDLYRIRLDDQEQARLAIVLEHFAQLFTGKIPNPEGLRKGDFEGSHRNRQGYDMGYHHFIGRLGMADEMPTYAEMVPEWRPGGLDNHFLGWDTLTHGSSP